MELRLSVVDVDPLNVKRQVVIGSASMALKQLVQAADEVSV